MKLKLVVVDLELSKRAKRIAAAVLAPLIVLGGGAIAYASVPHTWSDGDTLAAADLNADFSALDGRLTALEQAKTTDEGSLASLGTRVGALEQAAPNVASAIAALQTPIGARYHIVTANTLVGGNFPAPWTLVNFDAKDWDTNNAVTTGAGWQFKAPAAGKYAVTVWFDGAFSSSSTPALAYAGIRLDINGGIYSSPLLDQRFDYAAGNMQLAGADTIQLAAGDTVSIVFSTDTGGGTFNGADGAVTFTRISD